MSIEVNDLVNFCVDKAKTLRAELDREQVVLEKNEKTMTDEQFETLTISCATITGHILALRQVTEWAKDQR